MSRPVVLVWVSCLLAPALFGCESGEFVPPPPPELGPPALSATEPAARVVELVLASDQTPERTAWAQVVRIEAGVARVGFRLAAPGPKDPPGRQAALIRDAAARGASALIVEPARAPQVAEALEQVRAQGTPSVLLGESLSVPGKSLPAVLPAPAAESARELVEAAVADAKAAKLPGDGKAVLVVPRAPDVHTGENRAALRDALEAAGVAQAGPVEFEGSSEGAAKAILARVKADPAITLVLTADGTAFTGAIGAREQLLKEGRTIIVAGYSEVDPYGNEAAFQMSAAVADRNLVKMGRRAFQAALRLATGQVVEDRIVVPATVRRYASGTPAPLPQPRGEPAKAPSKSD